MCKECGEKRCTRSKYTTVAMLATNTDEGGCELGVMPHVASIDEHSQGGRADSFYVDSEEDPVLVQGDYGLRGLESRYSRYTTNMTS